ncbi:hypothetical protein SDC9_99379 [bioreactor metagenome]|uniref:Uncharacterized protein n=1 Tax=bioreactor metagenome TaxID=1076179 RepID=A0A645AHG6_9ZZZZ
MQRQQPGKQRQAGGGGHQQPHRAVLAQPQPRQVTTHDFRQGGQQIESERLHAPIVEAIKPSSRQAAEAGLAPARARLRTSASNSSAGSGGLSK